MPHYPDEIEYSDKYVDDFYEYRHVILPKDVYKRIPRGRLLAEQVLMSSCRSGALMACSNRGGGSTMRFTSPSRTFCSSAGPRDVTHRLASLLPASLLLLTHLSSEFVIIHHLHFDTQGRIFNGLG
jgi:hypothetical protein